MGQPKKRIKVGTYTHPKYEGAVVIQVPSNMRLPSWIDIYIVGQNDPVHFWIKKEKETNAN